MAKLIRICCMAGLSIMLLCLTACKEEATVNSQEPAAVVSKSINKPKQASKKTAKPKVANKSEQLKKESATEKLGKNSKPVFSENRASIEKQAGVKNSGDSSTVKKSEITTTLLKYDTKGRVDPFIPLLSEKKEPTPPAVGVDGKQIKLRPKRILTPLEKMDISQIKLVAVIEMKGRSVAMVEEASGKGYEVSVGTYMGKNNGQVTAINSDGITVKEYVRDFKGIL
ncbi:MAG: pilus assembly protein PilP, partial [Desulfobacterales bacterium]|nr:pilus assembly protein PilP [Desulfobacterales bacterium]